MNVVRFRCPKCQSLHSAAVARIGQVFPCKVCFGPMVVPEPTAGATPTGVSVASAPEPPTPVPVAIPPARVARPTEAPAPKRPARVRRPVDPTPVPVANPEPEARPSKRKWSPARGTVVRCAVAVALVGLVVAAIAGIRNLGGSWPEVALAAGPPSQPATPALPTPAIEAPATLPAPPPPEPVVLPAPPIAAAKPVATVANPARPLLIRRQSLDQEALRRELARVPELAADAGTRLGLLSLHGVTPTGRRDREEQLENAMRQKIDAIMAARAEALRVQQMMMQGATAHHHSKVPKHQLHHPKPAVAPAATVDLPAPTVAQAPPTMHVARDESATHDMLALIREVQPELAALPWRMGDDCHLGREPAEELQEVSRALRNLLVKVTPKGDTRPDANQLRAALLKDGPEMSPAMVIPAAIPALQQLLMAERTPVRLVLAEILEKIPGRDATRALAKLAMFDLDAEVRERAVLALKARPVEDRRLTLVEGLRYPWPPVADHAAEALVALGDRESVPDLVELLDRPDPAKPRTEVREGKPVTLVSSVVQVNHLRNCVLCHAPSANPTGDLVRGRVPDESRPLPPPVEYYVNGSAGLFVRAEVTYLRQDFSTIQPVEDADPWPSYQRYDYLVAERVVASLPTDPELKAPETYPQRESVLFALRELTGRDLGGRSDDWKAALADAP